MTSIDPGALSPRDRYRLMISAIVPRPIAWVTTLFPDGRVNAAPFSYFNGVSSTPPLVSIAVGRKGRTGEKKDTLRNVEATGELVVNVVSQPSLRAMVASSGDSDTARAGLRTVPSEAVAVPGLADARVRFECRLHALLDLPEANATLVLARILRIRADDEVLKGGVVDPRALDPVARLGGDAYARLGDITDVTRPEEPK
ncbi:MAG: flavin reductase family protein [Planctomycetales bacterium]|nr:flavin reductase family protein [Planctomycetales bacterium]